MELLRLVGPVLAALGAALLFDRMSRRRGLDPPGFARPERRLAALALLAFALYVAVFSPLATLGRASEPDLSQIATWQLFALHVLFALTIAGWFVSGFVGLGDPAAPALGKRLAAQLGWTAPKLGPELLVGVVTGVGAWLLVLAGVLLFALALAGLGGEEMLPQAPPALIPWLASRPLLLRLGIAASAGLVEESFFRGLLQPRLGIGLSTLCFAMAHLSYDQPLMLVGVTLLSLLYAGLVRWRQNIWSAVVAHFLFDAIQLAVVIPAVLRFWSPAPGATP